MDQDNNEIKPTRKLVIVFGAAYGTTPIEQLIHTDQDDCPQLLYKQLDDPIKRPSRIDRLSVRLGFKQGRFGQSKSNLAIPSSTGHKLLNDEAVMKPYKFLLANYKPGDDVVIIVESNDRYEARLSAAAMLVRHLRGDVFAGPPSDPSTGGDNIPSRQMPIHLIVGLLETADGASTLSRYVESRFPLGLKQIICLTTSGQRNCSCSTKFGSNGGVVSRELCFYDNTIREMDEFIYSTKDIIHYRPNEVPEWDQQVPVWAEIMNTPPGGPLGVVPLASAGPAGMYQHELRKYQEWPTRVVWKSTCHSDAVCI
ncbi:hypothetical protein RSOL_372950 [Rhizoctonia solani AG-3 Rhs1AP]|uniref:Uncharacterized protein n=1 Tax=Rhizoctonia solani AG-3 Rhs1AP TaxID=1086054 RepID=X8JA47_9AGAM|nr:hypothetical protein RSOL_372950 [Rhizoctonia solani AG-3 Rhs1AP]